MTQYEKAVALWRQKNITNDAELAEAGLAAMERWMNELGVSMNIRELGVTEDMLDGIADGTFLMNGGYKPLTRDDVITILKASM